MITLDLKTKIQVCLILLKRGSTAQKKEAIEFLKEIFKSMV